VQVGFNSVYHFTDLPSFDEWRVCCSFDLQGVYLPNVSVKNPVKSVFLQLQLPRSMITAVGFYRCFHLQSRLEVIPKSFYYWFPVLAYVASLFILLCKFCAWHELERYFPPNANCASSCMLAESQLKLKMPKAFLSHYLGTLFQYVFLLLAHDCRKHHSSM
jgi:hypothetical protein